MQCQSCQKECLESELENGLCSDCRKKLQNGKRIKNKVSIKINSLVLALHIVGYLFSAICGIYLFTQKDIISGIIIIVIGVGVTMFSTVLLEALSEIIQLLQDIKINK